MAKMLVFPYNLFCLLKFCIFCDGFRLDFFHFTSILGVFDGSSDQGVDNDGVCDKNATKRQDYKE